MTNAVAQSRPNFPVSWDRPGDERMFWMLDRLFFTHQITPLEADFVCNVCFASFETAAEASRFPCDSTGASLTRASSTP
jgi:hypothetical protein